MSFPSVRVPFHPFNRYYNGVGTLRTGRRILDAMMAAVVLLTGLEQIAQASASNVVVMIYGAGGGGWEYDRWRPVWARAGWQVITPDLQPARGRLDQTTFEDYTTQVRNWIPRKRRRLVIVGGSMGGLLALRVAQDVKPDALILVNSAPPAGVGEARTEKHYPPIVKWANGPISGYPRLFAGWRRDDDTMGRETLARRIRGGAEHYPTGSPCAAACHTNAGHSRCRRPGCASCIRSGAGALGEGGRAFICGYKPHWAALRPPCCRNRRGRKALGFKRASTVTPCKVSDRDRERAAPKSLRLLARGCEVSPFTATSNGPRRFNAKDGGEACLAWPVASCSWKTNGWRLIFIGNDFPAVPATSSATVV